MLETCSAPPELAGCIEMLWHYQGAAPPHAAERMLPSGAMQLVINLREDAFWVAGSTGQPVVQLGSAAVCGVYSQPFAIPTATQVSSMGVVFKPGGAFPFWGVPLGELHNLHVALDDVWGSAAGRWLEQLRAAPTVDGKFALLAQALCRHARRPLAPHPAVAAALELLQLGNVAVAGLAKHSGVSQQRLAQLFGEQVGMRPKQLARIWRFRRCLRSLGDGSAWAERAADYGYFDQAHMSAEFRAFTGLPPGAFWARWGKQGNHLPLDA